MKLLLYVLWHVINVTADGDFGLRNHPQEGGIVCWWSVIELNHVQSVLLLCCVAFSTARFDLIWWETVVAVSFIHSNQFPQCLCNIQIFLNSKMIKTLFNSVAHLPRTALFPSPSLPWREQSCYVHWPTFLKSVCFLQETFSVDGGNMNRKTFSKVFLLYSWNKHFCKRVLS